MQQRRRFLRPLSLAMTVLSSLALGGQAVSAPLAPAPTFLRFTLAGSDVRDGLTFLRYDVKADYYLSADTEGRRRSYQSASLTLSPQRNEELVGERGVQVQAVVLPRLRSGRGINIGDTPAVVKQKLGALPTTTSYDRRTRQLVYTYATTFSLSHGAIVHKRMNYLGTYTFHKDHLWSVEYNLNEPGEQG